MTNEQLHEFRKQIDACIVVAEKDLQEPDSSIYRRELSLVRTKLQEAKMWGGKCLEMSGAPFPKELRDKSGGIK